MSDTAYIYTLSDPNTKQIRYVGKTFNLKQRLYGHLHYQKDRQRTKNSCWIQKLKDEGIAPIMEELESFPASETSQWEEAERFWIDTLRFYGCNLNNLCSGGGSGRKHSTETLLKIGEHSKKRVHSPETRSKIAASCKARMTPEEKERLRIKCTGWKQSEEIKKHLSSVKKGIPKPEHVRKALLAGSLKWKAERGYLPRKHEILNRA